MDINDYQFPMTDYHKKYYEQLAKYMAEIKLNDSHIQSSLVIEDVQIQKNPVAEDLEQTIQSHGDIIRRSTILREKESKSDEWEIATMLPTDEAFDQYVKLIKVYIELMSIPEVRNPLVVGKITP